MLHTQLARSSGKNLDIFSVNDALISGAEQCYFKQYVFRKNTQQSILMTYFCTKIHVKDTNIEINIYVQGMRIIQN